MKLARQQARNSAQGWVIMKLALIIAWAVLACGCVDKKKQFERDMWAYEANCDQYYSAYISGGTEPAKKAMHDVIDLSKLEKSKAKFYWRFDINIAFAAARLAVIAEEGGHEDEANRLFEVASDHEQVGELAFAQEIGSSTNNIARWTPEFWRKAIAGLDEQMKVKWKPLNTAPQPPAAVPSVSTNK